MTIVSSAELKPGFLDHLMGTENVWTGKALHVESGKEAIALGNSREEAIYEASKKLAREMNR